MPDKIDAEKFTNILFTGIEISLDNLINRNATSVLDDKALYQYMIVHSDMSFEIKRQERIKKLYYPESPDAIQTGELKGYILVPDIDYRQEHNDIKIFLKVLETLFNKDVK